MKEAPREQREMIRLWTLVLIRILLILMGLAILILALYTLRTLLLLLVLSIFFCYLIAPLVRLLEQPVYLGGRELKLPRSAAIGVVYLATGAVLFFALQWFMPIVWEQVTDLGKNLPAHFSAASTWANQTFNDASSWMRHLRIPPSWRNAVISQLSHAAESLLPALEGTVLGALGYLKYLPWLIIVPILSFFLSINAYLAAYTIGTFKLSYFRFSPTEIRILLAAGNIAAFFRPRVAVLGGKHFLFDVAGTVAIALMSVLLIISVARNTATLYRAEKV